MVIPERTIVWDPEAIDQLKEAYKYIEKKSPRNAAKVFDDIEAAISKLLSYPERHPLDKYKLNNDGTFRAFEKHRYRIGYRVIETEIQVLRLRHTSMEPTLH